MINLTPFLLFDGNCAEAMTFYRSGCGRELTLTKAGDSPMKNQLPPEVHQKIIFAHLKNGYIVFTVTDWMHLGSYGHLADKFGVHWFFQGDRN